MATNLRLHPETEAALRAESARTGVSQQEIIRAALDRYLGLSDDESALTDTEALLRSGLVKPARHPFREAEELFTLRPGVTSLDLLDREDRI